jgi:diguanylate cyclase (GGDEF)-like protein
MLSEDIYRKVLPIGSVVLNVIVSSAALAVGDRQLAIAVAVSSLIVTVLFGLYLKKLYKKTKVLEYKARHDPLTGLLNRSSYNDILQKILASPENKTIAVMLLDLNKFKIVNDTMGHLVGDELLKQVAHRLSKGLRNHDYLARIGGDEFAFIFTNFESDVNLSSIANRLLHSFDAPFKLNESISEVGASLGIALYPAHGVTAVDLVKCADVAMYTAKNGRLGFFIYDKDQDVSSIESLTLRADLRQAVEAGELKLHYQPKKSLTTGKIVGIEALARWTHALLGEIPPSKFIPIAEHTGLIKTLTNWVVHQALDDFVKLSELGVLTNVSVNISPYSLAQGDLILHISKELATHTIDPQNLILEVTETSLNQGSEEFIKILLCLDMLGLSISIDDFGIGQSSLVYLKSLPVKEIKIDQSFVALMLENKQDYNIISSIIQLAHSVGCTVCAEGVEDQKTEDALRALKCDLVQGYYISKPLPLTQLYEFLGVPDDVPSAQ